MTSEALTPVTLMASFLAKLANLLSVSLHPD